jgi:hypothetical protein
VNTKAKIFSHIARRAEPTFCKVFILSWRVTDAYGCCGRKKNKKIKKKSKKSKKSENICLLPELNRRNGSKKDAKKKCLLPELN